MRGFRPKVMQAGPQLPAGARAYAELRRMILHGELRPEGVIAEDETAARLGVSRTPVREALRELLREGLVREGPRRQVIVVAVTRAAQREVLLVRDAVEPLAARHAALQMDTSEIDQLRLLVIRQRRAIQRASIHEYLDADDEFHARIASWGELLLEDLIRQVRAFVRLSLLGAEISVADLEAATTQHEGIIEALESHDPDAAERATADHLAATRDILKGGSTARKAAQGRLRT